MKLCNRIPVLVDLFYSGGRTFSQVNNWSSREHLRDWSAFEGLGKHFLSGPTERHSFKEITNVLYFDSSKIVLSIQRAILESDPGVLLHFRVLVGGSTYPQGTDLQF